MTVVVKAAEPRAYRLLHEGMLALARVEAAGIRIDTDYLDRAIKDADARAAGLEADLKRDEVWKVWQARHKGRANITSRQQLADVLFHGVGVPYPAGDARTATGKYRTDDAVLSKVDLPFMDGLRRLLDLQKDRGTYLEGIRREAVGGFFHPTFNLHTATTFRSSSGSDRENSTGGGRDLNFQNLPVRDPARAEMVRKAFVPRRPDWRLVEVDFSGIEVRVAACYNHDPALIKYIEDPTTDMHRDTAAQLFGFDVGFLVKEAAWAKKTVRDWSKNRFVFPQFYGSVYFQCAPHLWEAVTENKAEVPGTGLTVRKWLRKQGVRGLGDCDPRGDPAPDSFAHRCREVEQSFWQKRFTAYARWKKDWFAAYQRDLGFKTLTGFWIHPIGGKAGVLKRNDVTNWPIQSAAFHCLLWSLTQIVKEAKRKRMRAKVIGQIHDSVIADVPEFEVDDFLSLCHRVMTKDLLKHWEWICVPMAVEAEVAPAGESWNAKRHYDIPGV